MSQIFYLGLSFHFMSKNGQHFDYLSEYFFQHFMKNELGRV